MNFFIIYPLIIVSLLIKLDKFGIRANQNTLDLILNGEAVIRSITGFLKTLYLERERAPYRYVGVNDEQFKLCQGRKKFTSDIFVEVPEETQVQLWQNSLFSNSLSVLNNNTLIIPGQLGVFLLMVFNQIMCEASNLIEDLDKFSTKKQKKYLKFLTRLYNKNVQMIPEANINFFSDAQPFICIKKELYRVPYQDLSKLVYIVNKSPKYRPRSLLLYDCFNTKTQKTISSFLAKIRLSNTKCSRLMEEANHVSFEYIERFHGIGPLQSILMHKINNKGLRFRSALRKSLSGKTIPDSYHINARRHISGSDDLILEDSDVDQHWKLKLKKSSNAEGKTKKTIFRRISSFIRKKPKELVNKNDLKGITETKEIKDSSNSLSDNSIYDIVPYREFSDASTQTEQPSSSGTTKDSKSLEPIHATIAPKRSRFEDNDFQFIDEEEMEDEPLALQHVKTIADVHPHPRT